MYLFLNPTVISTINITSTFFYKQLSCQGSKNKKVKQLAKQPLSLKMLMQKNLVRLRVKNFTFLVVSSLNLNFSTAVSGIT